jgi:hypothetical protein
MTFNIEMYSLMAAEGEGEGERERKGGEKEIYQYHWRK